MNIDRKSWHFKIYDWYREGDIPRITNLCSYVRSVMIWAPLKLLYHFSEALFRKSKLSSWPCPKSKKTLISIGFTLFAVLLASLALWVNPDVAFAVGFAFSWLVFLINSERLGKKLEQSDAKIVRAGRKLPKAASYILKPIFCTFWEKIYNLNQVLFWIVLSSAVGSFMWMFVFVGAWQVPVVIGGIVGVVLLLILGSIIHDTLRFGSHGSILWQWIKAKKRKICPLIELRNGYVSTRKDKEA